MEFIPTFWFRIFIWYVSHTMTGEPSFEWDPIKERANRAKHGVSFSLAQRAFFDPRRIIAEDLSHSGTEQRYYCFGDVDGSVMTVRFTWPNSVSGFSRRYWRKGKTIYEQQNR